MNTPARAAKNPRKALRAALPEEKSYVARAQKGDKDAYRYLVQGYQDRLFSLVLSMISKREQAEDLTQEIFIKAYFALPRFAGDSAFYTWLFRIASNHCLDYLRKRKLPEISLDSPLEDEGTFDRLQTLEAPSSETPEASLKDPSEVAGVLEKLEPDQRLILSLRELEGYSYDELAKILHCGVNTIKSRLNRARQALKVAFERKYGNIIDDKIVQEAEGEAP